MMELGELNTPSAVIEQARMAANIRRMQQRMDSLHVRFRPHVKTSKCPQVIQAQLLAGAEGITVSTLKEARVCFAEGVKDILYAVSLDPGKLPEVLDLRRRGCDLKILVDNLRAAEAIAQVAAEQREPLEAWIEVDTDGHRAGVRPDDPLLLGIARVLQGDYVTLGGVLAHAGSSYEVDTPSALQAIAEQERKACVASARAIRESGMSCPEVSVGSTPTALSARSLDGVTEVRAGVYVFFDLVMANTGVCRVDDIALSVLTTVIGHRVDKGWIIVDAGWMAMSRDRGTSTQGRDYGYGLVCDDAGQPIPGHVMVQANQEHGIVHRIDASDRSVVDAFPVGTRLRILPNHACATGAQFDAYEVVDGPRHVATWSRFHGW